MHANYQNPVMRNLTDQQNRFAPREKKIEQITNAEQLIHEINPQRTYPFDYLCFRITGYRPNSFPSANLSGVDAAHDLRLFVEDVSDSTDLEANTMGEPVYTVEELSRQFRVSTKTISRWRQQGLVSRRLLFGGRKRVGFLKSSVDRFVANNGDRVERGSRFSQLTTLQRNEIIEGARRMASVGGCPAEISRHLAKRTGRSVETIRYTLRQFDKDHPTVAIFPNATGPLTDELKMKIYQ